MNITDAEYKRLIQENKELKVQRDQLREALEEFMDYDAEENGDTSMIDADWLWVKGSSALEATRSD